jgi:hypothetical protein
MAVEGTSQNQAATAVDQTPEIQEHRVFLNDRGEGTFICPACDKGVIRDLSQFSAIESVIRLKCKCSCGNVYRTLVERRHHFRKPVNLMGTFLFEKGQDKPVKGLIKIQDISQSGIRFSMSSVPVFSVGDRLNIEFTLDDEERSQIREEGIVQRIHENIIGLTFKHTDHYGKLGQYLFR